ncbi:MAG: hypothetical protein ACKVOT_13855 [Polaromonas sp.]
MKHLGTSANASDIAVKSQLPVSDPTAVLTNNTVATTETVVARWALPANFLAAGSNLQGAFAGQVSGTATVAFRVRIGTLGTAADALAATFVTSAAGTANQHVFGELLISCFTAGASGTATAAGVVQFGALNLAVATGGFAAATVNTTAALFVSVTLVQSAAQTYTSRAATLTRSN